MMKNILKYTAMSLCGAALLTCLVVSFLAGRKSRIPVLCKDIEVTITDSTDNRFVSGKEIRKLIDREYGRCTGIHIDSIDMTRIEAIVDSRSAVLKSQVYATQDGILHVSLSQRTPAVRFQKEDGGFYADPDGYVFPLQENHTSYVYVIDGHIPLHAYTGHKGYIEDPKDKEWFDTIMNLVNHIEESKVWKGKFVQIHVQKNGELILIPRIGQEKILFGQPTDIGEKFLRLEKYYTHIIPEKGKEYYRTVDVRFRNRIVCRQDDIQEI